MSLLLAVVGSFWFSVFKAASKSLVELTDGADDTFLATGDCVLVVSVVLAVVVAVLCFW